MNSDRIRIALKAKLPRAEYALCFEVRNAAGFGATRSADAVAMSLWPSRGLEILGFEIKVDRRDWLRELKNPSKAEAIAQYCDRWIILAPPAIVEQTELPPGWGLWVLHEDGRFAAVVTPPLRTPVPITKDFLAAVLRRAHEADAELVDALIAKQRADEKLQAETRFEREVEYRVQNRTHRYGELEKAVAAFETAAGIKIGDAWEAGEIGKAVRLVREKGDDYFIAQAKSLRDRLDRLLAEEAQVGG
jgi:hypothetical protein